MKMNSSNMFFLTIMTVGVMMSLCSNNWLFIWCGLELSLISFLPLISNNLIISSESSMKYFLVQSLSSSILILGLIMMLTVSRDYCFIISISLLIKMGVSPFHMWVLSVVEGLSMVPMVLMFTLSKLTPLMMMTMILTSLSLIIPVTLVTGALLGLNQTSTRKIIAYSSIFNLGLILISIKNNFVWCYYMLVYSLLVGLLIYFIFEMNMFYMNQLIFNEEFIFNKMNISFILLSLGGVPPFLGFSIKLMVIEFSMSEMMMLNLTLIIMFSLLVMFFYLRLVYSSIMFFSLSSKWMLTKKNSISLKFMVFNLSTLPLFLTAKIFY